MTETGTGTAAAYLPPRLSLRALREAARDCRACPLWRSGTQTVYGEGRRTARPTPRTPSRDRGASARRPRVRVTRNRGRPLESTLAPVALATVHPSSILRAPDLETRRRERALFVGDLGVAAAALG